MNDRLTLQKVGGKKSFCFPLSAAFTIDPHMLQPAHLDGVCSRKTKMLLLRCTSENEKNKEERALSSLHSKILKRAC